MERVGKPASVLRERRRDFNDKPNRHLDRRTSRAMMYVNEELRKHTISINDEVEKGQNDMKKLRRTNDQLRRELWWLREEYDKVKRVLDAICGSTYASNDILRQHGYAEDSTETTNDFEKEQNLRNITCIEFQSSECCTKGIDEHSIVEPHYVPVWDSDPSKCSEYCLGCMKPIKTNLESILPEEDCDTLHDKKFSGSSSTHCGYELTCSPTYEIPPLLELPQNSVTYKNKNENIHVSCNEGGGPTDSINVVGSRNENGGYGFTNKSKFPEGGNLDELLSDVQEKRDLPSRSDASQPYFQSSNFRIWNEASNYSYIAMNQTNGHCTSGGSEQGNHNTFIDGSIKMAEIGHYNMLSNYIGCTKTSRLDSDALPQSCPSMPLEDISGQKPTYQFGYSGSKDEECSMRNDHHLTEVGANYSPLKLNGESFSNEALTDTGILTNLQNKKWVSKSMQNLNVEKKGDVLSKMGSFPQLNEKVEMIQRDDQGLPIKNLQNTSVGFQDRGRRSKGVLNPEVTHLPDVFKLSSASSRFDEEKNESCLMNDDLQCLMNGSVSFSGGLASNINNKKKKVSCVSTDGLYHCVHSFSKTNRKSSGYGSHFQSLHKMSVILGDTQLARSVYVDHSLASSYMQDTLSKRHCVKQMSVCSNNQRKLGVCSREDMPNGSGDIVIEPGVSDGTTRSTNCLPVQGSLDDSSRTLSQGKYQTWERKNSTVSLSSSKDITKTKFEGSVNSVERTANEGSLPWCGCWGNGCI